MQLSNVALASIVSAAAAAESTNTFIFSRDHNTYTVTLHGSKAEHLTTTHMTIERPHHTLTKTFFTWMGPGSAPTDVDYDTDGDTDSDTDSDSDDDITTGSSKTYIFSYPHNTYTKTLYGEKAQHLTTTHMTIEKPNHTHTKTFFTWMGQGAQPSGVDEMNSEMDGSDGVAGAAVATDSASSGSVSASASGSARITSATSSSGSSSASASEARSASGSASGSASLGSASNSRSSAASSAASGSAGASGSAASAATSGSSASSSSASSFDNAAGSVVFGAGSLAAGIAVLLL